MSVLFDNQSGETVDIYWDNLQKFKNGKFIETLEHNESMRMKTKPGDTFHFEPEHDETTIYETIIEKDTESVILHDRKTMQNEKRNWMNEYYESTGTKWKNYYPRRAVKWYYHEAEQGDVIDIQTDRTKFHICKDGELNFADIAKLDSMENPQYSIAAMMAFGYIFMCCMLTLIEMKKTLQKWADQSERYVKYLVKVTIELINIVMIAVFVFGVITSTAMYSIRTRKEMNKKKVPPSYQMENDLFYIARMNDTTYCRPKQNDEIEIVNVCGHGPHAFRVYNFLNDDEIEHITNLGQFLGMSTSTMVIDGKLTTGNGRTSQTAWLSRDSSFIVENIVRRIADVVNVPQENLFKNASAEDLQLVHYFEGQRYGKHHDYGVDAPYARYITFLMYLNDVEEGGYTSFPNADERCEDENGYFGFQPIKGSVAFFYNMYPDGNVDPKTLHRADPPLNGSEKWMTNLWIWDPLYFFGYD